MLVLHGEMMRGMKHTPDSNQKEVKERHKLANKYRAAIFKLSKYGFKVKFGDTLRDIPMSEVLPILKKLHDMGAELRGEDYFTFKRFIQYVTSWKPYRTSYRETPIVTSWAAYKKLRDTLTAPKPSTPKENIIEKGVRKKKLRFLRFKQKGHDAVKRKSDKFRAANPEGCTHTGYATKAEALAVYAANPTLGEPLQQKVRLCRKCNSYYLLREKRLAPKKS